MLAPRTFNDGNAINLVLVASNRPLDLAGADPADASDEVILEGDALDRFVASAPVIRDDYAPIDQWLDADKS